METEKMKVLTGGKDGGNESDGKWNISAIDMVEAGQSQLSDTWVKSKDVISWLMALYHKLVGST